MGRQKETVLAVELLRRAQSTYPADFPVHFWLAASLSDLKVERRASLEEALGCMRAALAVRPQSSIAYNGLGVALHQTKNLAGAIAPMQTRANRGPNRRNSWASRTHGTRGPGSPESAAS